MVLFIGPCAANIFVKRKKLKILIKKLYYTLELDTVLWETVTLIEYDRVLLESIPDTYTFHLDGVTPKSVTRG